MSAHPGSRLWATTAAVALLAMPGSLAAQEADDEDVLLDEITVSSSKRDVSLGSLASGVSILDEQQLEDAQIDATPDLEKLVPSLKSNLRGSRAFSSFTIRGLGSADFYNPAVALYVDGVPQDPSALDQIMVDAERVEVLKGPQGTLYGRNAHAGVINITTEQPDNETRVDLGATAATLKPDAQVLVSGPLIDDMLYASAAVKFAVDRGQSDNLVTNEENDDDANNSFYRGKIRYAPSGSPLDVTLTYSHDHLEAEELFFDEAGFEDRESVVPFTDTIERDIQTGALGVNYEFEEVTVTSVTSVQLRDLNRAVSRPQDERQNSYTEELRAVYGPEDGRFSGVLGTFLQAATFERDATSGFTGNLYDADVDTESYALFGEGSYDLTKAFTATLGLRYAYDWAELDFNEVGGLQFQEDDDWSAILPKAGLSYRLSDDVSLYSTVSRGYKPGGFNRTATNTAAEIPYDNEYSTNYEAGVRADILGGSVPLQASVYWTEIDDAQLFTGELGQLVVRNLGDARSYGIELEGSALVTDALELSGGVHLNEAEFKEGAETNGIDLEGNRLPFAPEYQLSLAAQYYWEPADLDGVVVPRIAVTYFGETFFEETNTFSQDPYAIVDLSVAYEAPEFTVIGFVNNVFDEDFKVYQASENTIQAGDGLNAGIRFAVNF